MGKKNKSNIGAWLGRAILVAAFAFFIRTAMQEKLAYKSDVQELIRNTIRGHSPNILKSMKKFPSILNQISRSTFRDEEDGQTYSSSRAELLTLATVALDLHVAEALLENGADPNEYYYDHSLPLHHLFVGGQRRANDIIPDIQGRVFSPYYDRFYKDIGLNYKSSSIPTNRLGEGMQSHALAMVKLHLKYGFNATKKCLNPQSEEQDSNTEQEGYQMHKAQNMKLTKKEEEGGITVELKQREDHGMNIFHLLCLGGPSVSGEVAQVLIDSVDKAERYSALNLDAAFGAEVHEATRVAPLYLCAQRGNADVSARLVAAGANQEQQVHKFELHESYAFISPNWFYKHGGPFDPEERKKIPNSDRYRHPPQRTIPANKTETLFQNTDTGGWRSKVPQPDSYKYAPGCDFDTVAFDELDGMELLSHYVELNTPVLIKGAFGKDHDIWNQFEVKNFLKSHGKKMMRKQQIPQFGHYERYNLLEPPETSLFSAMKDFGNTDRKEHDLLYWRSTGHVFTPHFTKTGKDDYESIMQEELACAEPFASALGPRYDTVPKFLNKAMISDPVLMVGPRKSGLAVRPVVDDAILSFRVYGQARWIMYRPQDAIFSTQSISDHFEKEIARNGTLKSKPLQCIQEQGDIFFAPAAWAAGMLNTEPGVAMNWDVGPEGKVGGIPMTLPSGATRIEAMFSPYLKGDEDSE
jgi:hypothetical protein